MSYATVVIIGTVLLAVITNFRISYVLGQRWKLYSSDGDFPIFEIFSAIVAAILFYYISRAAFDNFAMLGGLLAAAGTIPISGFIWVFIVGGNKAIERVLTGLMKKVE